MLPLQTAYLSIVVLAHIDYGNKNTADSSTLFWRFFDMFVCTNFYYNWLHL